MDWPESITKGTNSGESVPNCGAFGESIKERLFVYGTLGPNRPNEHILKSIGGTWEPASIAGILRSEGWGAEMGYPGIHLDENCNEVEGFLFTSENLSQHWASLDAFEGQAYCRVRGNVKLKNGNKVDA